MKKRIASNSTHDTRIKTEMAPATYPRTSTLSIPFPDIPICAGFPSPAADFTENSVNLNELLIKHPSATFFIKVSGASMTGAGIFPGDLLVVDRSVEPQHNTVVIAILNGEFTVKRLLKSSNSITLAPENPQYRPISVTEGSDFEVWGVVTHVIHSPSSPAQ